MASGTTRYGAQLLQVPALHREGHVISIAFTVTLLPGPDGRLAGIAAVIRDETEARERRLRLEAELRERSG